MFDYALAQNQKRRPTRRILASWIISCITHILALLVLIQYPQLLQGGMGHHFRSIPIISRIFGLKTAEDSRNWRTVAVLRNPSSMSAPSAETLKKYLFDWSKKQQTAPIQVRWGDIKAALADLPPMPRVRKEVKDPNLSLPANNLASAGSANVSDGNDAASASSGSTDPDGDPNGAFKLPSQETPQIPNVASNNPPSKIPDSIKPPPEAAPKETNTVKVFENEQKAIGSQESGFFDTKGFPLGEYASLIIERIKGNWFIPSTFKNASGRTTIIFYIDKTGRYINARIVLSSGNKTFDNSALLAIIESNPFPPLPKGFPGERVGAKFVFSYNEP